MYVFQIYVFLIVDKIHIHSLSIYIYVYIFCSVDKVNFYELQIEITTSNFNFKEIYITFYENF